MIELCNVSKTYLENGIREICVADRIRKARYTRSDGFRLLRP